MDAKGNVGRLTPEQIAVLEGTDRLAAAELRAALLENEGRVVVPVDRPDLLRAPRKVRRRWVRDEGKRIRRELKAARAAAEGGS